MRFGRRVFLGLMLLFVVAGLFPVSVTKAQCESTEIFTPDGTCEDTSLTPTEQQESAAPTAPGEDGVITTTDIDIEAGYQEIVNGPGLIFANICEEKKPQGGAEDECLCRSRGRCSLDDVLQVFVNICILILGISGSIVLLMFTYGGFLWITSQGEADRVARGKDTITRAVVGFAIILLSYTMINFVISALAGDRPSESIEDTIDNADDGTGTLTPSSTP